MSRFYSGLLLCSLFLGFSGEADAQRRARPTDAPAARCSDCGARASLGQRSERALPRRMLRREVSLRTERVSAPFEFAQREERSGEARDGKGRGRRGDAREGEGRGRRGDAREGEGRGRRGDAREGEGRGRRGDARGGEGRRRDSERARKQRERFRKQADTNGDGVLDQAERDALRKRIQERRNRGGGSEPGSPPPGSRPSSAAGARRA